MPYEKTIEQDIARAKAMLEKGKNEFAIGNLKMEGGTIYGVDIYAAYMLLKSFVEEIERLNARIAELTKERSSPEAS